MARVYVRPHVRDGDRVHGYWRRGDLTTVADTKARDLRLGDRVTSVTETPWHDVLPAGYTPQKAPPLARSTRKAKWKRDWFFMLRDLWEQGGYGWQPWGSGHQSSGIQQALWKRGAIERASSKRGPLLFRLAPKGHDELMGFYEDWRGVDYDPPDPPPGAPLQPLAHEPQLDETEAHRLAILRDDIAGLQANLARYREMEQDPETAPFLDKTLHTWQINQLREKLAELQDLRRTMRYSPSSGRARAA